MFARVLELSTTNAVSVDRLAAKEMKATETEVGSVLSQLVQVGLYGKRSIRRRIFELPFAKVGLERPEVNAKVRSRS
jgi:hypothetical protein